MKYDLEERTLKFAKNCIDICKKVEKNIINNELVKQLIRASCSIGANYREANDTITKRDFLHKAGICRREAKESKYWLELFLHANTNLNKELEQLIDESLQFARIFASMTPIKNKK